MDVAPGPLIVPLVLSLSLDTFAVSTAIGIAPLDGRARMRFALTFALAEAAMPLLGFAAGGLVGRLGSIADWVAVIVLLGSGLWIVREALDDDDEVLEALEKARRGGSALLIAALGVSLDELAVGLALGSLRVPVAPVVAALFGQALVASLIGLWLGGRIGTRAGSRATLLAGIVLCIVAIGLAVSNLR